MKNGIRKNFETKIKIEKHDEKQLPYYKVNLQVFLNKLTKGLSIVAIGLLDCNLNTCLLNILFT